MKRITLLMFLLFPFYLVGQTLDHDVLDKIKNQEKWPYEIVATFESFAEDEVSGQKIKWSDSSTEMDWGFVNQMLVRQPLLPTSNIVAWRVNDFFIIKSGSDWYWLGPTIYNIKKRDFEVVTDEPEVLVVDSKSDLKEPSFEGYNLYTLFSYYGSSGYGSAVSNSRAFLGNSYVFKGSWWEVEPAVEVGMRYLPLYSINRKWSEMQPVGRVKLKTYLTPVRDIELLVEGMYNFTLQRGNNDNYWELYSRAEYVQRRFRIGIAYFGSRSLIHDWSYKQVSAELKYFINYNLYAGVKSSSGNWQNGSGYLNQTRPKPGSILLGYWSPRWDGQISFGRFNSESAYQGQQVEQKDEWRINFYLKYRIL